MRILGALVALWAAAFSSVCAEEVRAEEVKLLLFDAKTHSKFAGCLNCSREEIESICNESGSYGSRYGSNSIWYVHGRFGSDSLVDSPWNLDGEGLVIMDQNGRVYGNFTRNRKASGGQSTLALVQYILRIYPRYVELSDVRNLVCER